MTAVLKQKLSPTQFDSEAMLAALPIAVYTTDAEGVITFYNQAAVNIWGRAPLLGKEKWCGALRLYRPDGSPLPHHECPMAQALESGEPVRNVEAVLERPDGSRIAILPHPTPILDEDGKVIGAINMLLDVSERHRSQQLQEHFAAIVASSDDAIVSKDLGGIIQSWNRGAERIFGYTPEEAIGRHITLVIPADRLDEEPGIIDRISRGERVDHFETKRQHKDGSLIDVSLTVSPVRDRHGEVVGASKIARDITDRKRAEEARDLLFQEIKHRVKNTLGTVQAIASQTFRSGSHEERDAFAARLRALSAAHDLLTNQDFDQVSAKDIIVRALLPFQENRAARIQPTGEDAVLTANQGLLLAMVIHELATNAVKYGALSNTAGIVRLSWSRMSDKDGCRLRLHWKESGGPKVEQPARKGFGSILLERALSQEAGRARMVYAPDGVDCTLEMKI